MKDAFWFKKKTYGWGWTPANWKGWGVTAAYILGMLAYPYLARAGYFEFSILVFWTLLVLSTVLFIFIAYKKGEKPEWRWGKDK